MATLVANGIYRFFNRDQLDAETVKYVFAVQTMTGQRAATGGQLIQSSSTAGVSTSLTLPPNIGSLEDWANQLQDAYDQLDILDAGNTPPPSDRSVAIFTPFLSVP